MRTRSPLPCLPISGFTHVALFSLASGMRCRGKSPESGAASSSNRRSGFLTRLSTIYTTKISALAKLLGIFRLYQISLNDAALSILEDATLSAASVTASYRRTAIPTNAPSGHSRSLLTHRPLRKILLTLPTANAARYASRGARTRIFARRRISRRARTAAARFRRRRARAVARCRCASATPSRIRRGGRRATGGTLRRDSAAMTGRISDSIFGWPRPSTPRMP